MRSLLERPVSFRLSAEAYERYEVEAARAGISVSKYLRDRLDADDFLSDQVAQLRLILLDNAAPAHSGGDLFPLLLELLLLARRQTPPGELRAIRAELERQGIATWTPNSQAD